MPSALRLKPLIAETSFIVFNPRSVILWPHKKISEKREQNSWLGHAISAILPTPVRAGWYQHYERGSIYYSDAGACLIYGHIRDKWAVMGWENGFLGFPVTDELGATDGVGRFNHFEGGSIYWTPETGAQEIHGDIRQKWFDLGAEQAGLGYPISGEVDVNQGRASNFQRGQIAWSPSAGAAVSSFIRPAPGSGVRPQDHGHAGVTNVRRRVVVSAHMDLTDHETFGANEHDSGDKSGQATVTSDMPQEAIDMEVVAGDEMRVELRLNAQAMISGDVMMTGTLRLFEGTDTRTSDLDGEESLSFIVVRDQFTAKSFVINNEDEGDDFANVTINISNFSV